MLSRYQWLLVIAATLVLGSGWMWLSRAPDGLGDVASPVTGQPAPDFTLQTFDGQSLTLSDLRGQVVVLNFWATWCPPCRAEMPALQEVYDAHANDDLVVVAVDQNESAEQVAAFRSELKLSFPLLLDRQYVVTDRYRVGLLPSTFFIDGDGVIRDVVYGGPMNRALLEDKIAPLLETR
jgi:peroxiredoxin